MLGNLDPEDAHKVTIANLCREYPTVSPEAVEATYRGILREFSGARIMNFTHIFAAKKAREALTQKTNGKKPDTT